MRVSREAKILVALVAVAAATWVWVNFFTQPTLDANTPTLNATAPVATPESPVVAGEDEVDPAVVASLGEALVAPPGTLTDEPALPIIASTAASEAGAETSLVAAESGGESGGVVAALESGGAVAQTQETGGATSVAAPSVAQPAALTARELNVAELPFLVTAPPSANLDEGVTAEGELELARPRDELRATVNPFSPILLDAPPEQPTADLPAPAPAPDTSLIQTVEIPDAPPVDAVTPTALAPVVPERVTAPAPRAVTPSSLQNGSLPKALPGGTLPATPKLLRNTRTVVATPTQTGPDSLAAVAAVRVPGERQASGFKTAAAPTLSASAETPEVAPLRFGGLPEPALAGGPLAAGTSSLSRYLRDNNYQFTGSVIGPVGVGVFRSKLSPTPVLVSLGKTLPDTEIVLSSLQGKQAEFTQNGNKQILILDLR